MAASLVQEAENMPVRCGRACYTQAQQESQARSAFVARTSVRSSCKRRRDEGTNTNLPKVGNLREVDERKARRLASLLRPDVDSLGIWEYTSGMETARYIYWHDGEMWLGYLEEFPDYMTQGETLEELRENLKDLRTDLTSGEIPGVRRVAELQLS